MALDKRLRRLLIVAIVASVLSLLAVFALSFGVQREELIASLSRLNPAVFAIAIGLHAGALLLWAARLYALADGSGHTQNPWVCIEAVFSSVFAAAVTPARFGGEPVRFGILTSRDMPPREGSLIVLLERGLDILLFILLGVWAFVELVPRLPRSALLALVVPVSIVFLIGLILVPLLILFKPRAAHPVLDLVEGLVGEDRTARAKEWLVVETARMRRALATVLGRKPSRFGFAVVATILSWMLEFGVLYYLLNVGFGHQIPFITVALGAALVSVLTTIPLLPGGSGLAEAGVLGVFTPFTEGLTATFVLVWRASTYYVDIVVGGVIAMRFAGAETMRVLSGDDEPDEQPPTPGEA
jgi:uncharacterized protein (TIRG00374 family)